jgi:hypothetical protein|tara:strand:+ start:387 stop:590 length:204 start_codon:yes stop_codon:yes gene_type:complete
LFFSNELISEWKSAALPTGEVTVVPPDFFSVAVNRRSGDLMNSEVPRLPPLSLTPPSAILFAKLLET